MIAALCWLFWFVCGLTLGHVATVLGWVIASSFADWRLRRRRLARLRGVRS